MGVENAAHAADFAAVKTYDDRALIVRSSCVLCEQRTSIVRSSCVVPAFSATKMKRTQVDRTAKKRRMRCDGSTDKEYGSRFIFHNYTCILYIHWLN